MLDGELRCRERPLPCFEGSYFLALHYLMSIRFYAGSLFYARDDHEFIDTRFTMITFSIKKHSTNKRPLFTIYVESKQSYTYN